MGAGTGVKPLDLAEIYGVDAFRYFLIRDLPPGRDVEFREESLARRYRGDLANNLGNLLHRLVNMIGQYCDGQIPEPGEATTDETALRGRCLTLVPETLSQVEALALNEALAGIMGVVAEINRYLERTAPWHQARMERTDRVATIVYYAAEALRLTSILLQPVLPERMAELWHRLGWQPPAMLRDGLSWGELEPGRQVVGGPPLFPRDVGEESGK